MEGRHQLCPVLGMHRLRLVPLGTYRNLGTAAPPNCPSLPARAVTGTVSVPLSAIAQLGRLSIMLSLDNFINGTLPFYQLDLVTPGICPSKANLRHSWRDIRNNWLTERGRFVLKHLPRRRTFELCRGILWLFLSRSRHNDDNTKTSASLPLYPPLTIEFPPLVPILGATDSP